MAEPTSPLQNASSTPHRRGAVAVVRNDQRFLIIRRSRHVVAPRAYCFPGGGIEPGETESQALVRELQEELNVTVRAERRLWTSVTPWNVQLSWWLTQIPEGQPFKPEPQEVESVHWCTIAEMRALPGLLTSNHQFLDAIQRGEIRLDT